MLYYYLTFIKNKNTGESWKKLYYEMYSKNGLYTITTTYDNIGLSAVLEVFSTYFLG